MGSRIDKILNQKTKRAFLFVLLISSLLLLVFSVKKFNSDNSFLDRAMTAHYAEDEYQDNLQNLVQNIEKLESDERGYTITGDKKFVETFDEQLGYINQLLSRQKNKEYTGSDFLNGHPVLTLDSFINKKIEFIKQVKSFRDRQELPQAIALISTGKGKTLTDSIIKIQTELDKMVRVHIENSRIAYDRSNRRNNRFAIAFMVASLVLLLVILLALIIEIRGKNEVSKELLQEKDHFRVTLETISEGLIRTNKNGEIVYMNAAAEKLTGWKNSDSKTISFQKVFDAIIEESGISYQVVLQSILLNGKPIEYDGDILLHPGRSDQKILHVNGSPIFELNKEISGSLLVFYDVTERKKNENKIRESEIFISGVVDSVKSHLAVINSSGTILKVNKPWDRFALENGETFLERCGKGANYFEVCLKGNPPDSVAIDAVTGIKEVLKGSISEFYLEYPCHSPFEKRWFYMRVKKFEGSETMAVIEHHDISNRKKAEIELKTALDSIQLLLDSIAEGAYGVDNNGICTFVNKSFLRLLGYNNASELIGKKIHLMIHHSHADGSLYPESECKMLNSRITKQQTNISDEVFWRKDGVAIPVEYWSYPIIQDEIILGAICTFIDITERKKYEKEIVEKSEELRLLSGHLQKIREEERTYMAREIHDELGQQLTVMKMDVSWLHGKLVNADEPIKRRMNELKEILDQTVATVRRISSELRPSILDDMGLSAAIEWHLSEFEKKSGVKTKFEPLHNELPLREIVKSNLFRIVQESLTNVSRYAHAKKVEVSLQQNNGNLSLTVKDDGVGFDAEEIIAKQTFGILGMKERSFMIGGTYEISSKPGKGTIVKVQVPYHKQASKQLKIL